MSDCIFCKIAAGEIPSDKIYEDDMILAFSDINPQAPVHALVIPKEHIASANEINAENAKYVSHIFAKIPSVASKLGVAEKGYRIINNCGAAAGQTVNHLHFHILAGCEMGEKLL